MELVEKGKASGWQAVVNGHDVVVLMGTRFKAVVHGLPMACSPVEDFHKSIGLAYKWMTKKERSSKKTSAEETDIAPVTM